MESETIYCPECKAKMVLRESKYGLFYGCSRFPKCKAAHGAHQNSGKPLGTPADKETKQWRMKAHDAFDKLWKKYGYKRQEAYGLLKMMMNLSSREAHIARFDKERCQELIRKIKQMK